MRFLLPALLALSLTAHAQYKDDRTLIAGDLEALNAHFDGLVRFSIDKQDRLVADLFRSGEAYRKDMAYVEFLDPAAFAFSAEEKLVVVRCTPEKGRCIDKEILEPRTISHSGRMGLPLPTGDPDGAQALALLGKLVRDKQMIDRRAGRNRSPQGT